MAHLLRLIAAVALLLFGSTAFAVIPMPTTSGYQAAMDLGGIYRQAFGATPDEACTALQGLHNAVQPTVTLEYKGRWGDAYCAFWLYRRSDGQYSSAVDAGYSSVPPRCPANSEAAPGGCACASGFVENTGKTACVAAPDECQALAGSPAGGKTWNGTASEFFFCDGWNTAGGGKCIVKASRSISVESPIGSGKYISSGDGVYTGGKGTTCDGGGGEGAPGKDSTPPGSDAPPTPKPGEAAPAPCPAGQQPGEFNGTRICAPVGPETPTKAPSPDTGSKEVKNPDGSTTTTTTTGTTECKGGNCTTTTTVTTVTKNPDGTVKDTKSEDKKETQAQTGFCTANPKVAQCAGTGDGASSSFGGDCVAGFKAKSDDAVINAMAEEAYRQNCKVNPDTDSQALAKAEALKTGNQTGDNPNNATVSISASQIDTSDALNAGGGCISDVTISVFGGSVVTLPTSRYCDHFAMLGTLLVALSFFAAAVIVLRG